MQPRLNIDSKGYMKIRLTGGKEELPRRVADMEGRGWEVVQIYADPDVHPLGDLTYNKHIVVMKRKQGYKAR